MYYYSGLEIYEEDDFLEAVKWFEKAADLGNCDAHIMLAIMYSEGIGVEEDEEIAEYWLQKAEETAEENNIDWIL